MLGNQENAWYRLRGSKFEFGVLILLDLKSSAFFYVRVFYLREFWFINPDLFNIIGTASQ